MGPTGGENSMTAQRPPLREHAGQGVRRKAGDGPVRRREPTHPGKPGESAGHPGWISRRFASDIAVNIGSRVAGIVARIHGPGRLNLLLASSMFSVE